MNKYSIYPKQFRHLNIPVENNRCFVLMPFDRKYDELYGTIKEELTNLSLICYRDDEIIGAEPFMNKVLTNILLARYVIVVLTDYRPNVLYELGVAHSFKEIQNVLIIVEKDAKFKSSIHQNLTDISHLTYFEYSSDNLFPLRAMLKKFIYENKTYADFQNILQNRCLIGSLSENENDFLEYLQSKLKEKITIITKILSQDIEDLSEKEGETIYITFESIMQQVMLEQKGNYLHHILMIYCEILGSCSILLPSLTEVFLYRLLGNYWNQFNINENLIISYKTDVAVYLAQQRKMLNIILPWIIEYFHRSKTSTIDLNRYKLESFLMTSPFDEVNQAISLSVFNEDCHIREHMSDIIGEKRIYKAFDNLTIQLQKELNYYSAVSMIEAIGKLGFSKGVIAIVNWIEENDSNIIARNEFFVLKHAIIAITKLKNKDNANIIENFISKYESYVNDNTIL